MWTSLVFAAVLAAPPEPDSGCRRDETGVAWALPFTLAVEAAEERHRLLLVKPIAFGTSKDGGW